MADNTFATPWVQRPLEFGFDVVMHSATKYLNGHSDMIGGAIVVGDNAELARAAGLPAQRRRRLLGPFDSFLALRGLKTLPLRMARHCENALAHRAAARRASASRARASTPACRPSAACAGARGR